MSFGKALEKVVGMVLEDSLPMFSAKEIGSAVVGIVAGFSSYTMKATEAEAARTVHYVKLKSALEYNAGTNKTAQHLAIGVPINADLKNKLDSATLEVGTYVLVQFKDVAAEFNNMRRYRVEIITKAQYNDLLRAESEHHVNG
jgi:hypothetical protein